MIVVQIILGVVLGLFAPQSPKTVQPLLVATANTTLNATHHVVIVTGANVTITLPAAAGNTGLEYTIANHSTTVTTFSVPIKVANSETMSAISPNLGGNAFRIISDGADWRMIGQ